MKPSRTEDCGEAWACPPMASLLTFLRPCLLVGVHLGGRLSLLQCQHASFVASPSISNIHTAQDLANIYRMLDSLLCGPLLLRGLDLTYFFIPQLQFLPGHPTSSQCLPSTCLPAYGGSILRAKHSEGDLTSLWPGPPTSPFSCLI